MPVSRNKGKKGRHNPVVRLTNAQRAFEAISAIERNEDVSVEKDPEGWFSIDYVYEIIQLHARNNNEVLGRRTNIYVASALAAANRKGYVEVDFTENIMKVNYQTGQKMATLHRELDGEEFENPRAKYYEACRQLRSKFPLAYITKQQLEEELQRARRELENAIRRAGCSCHRSDDPELRPATDPIAGPSSTMHRSSPVAADRFNEDVLVVSSDSTPVHDIIQVSPVRKHTSRNPADAYPTPDSAPRRRSPYVVPNSPPASPSPGPSRSLSLIEGNGMDIDPVEELHVAGGMADTCASCGGLREMYRRTNEELEKVRDDSAKQSEEIATRDAEIARQNIEVATLNATFLRREAEHTRREEEHAVTEADQRRQLLQTQEELNTIQEARHNLQTQLEGVQTQLRLTRDELEQVETQLQHESGIRATLEANATRLVDRASDLQLQVEVLLEEVDDMRGVRDGLREVLASYDRRTAERNERRNHRDEASTSHPGSH